MARSRNNNRERPKNDTVKTCKYREKMMRLFVVRYAVFASGWERVERFHRSLSIQRHISAERPQEPHGVKLWNVVSRVAGLRRLVGWRRTPSHPRGPATPPTRRRRPK